MSSRSQYYVEPKRLARLGYLEAHKEPGRTRERTVYSLTEKGIEALREWARTPARFTPVKSEPLLRLMITDLVGEEATRASLIALRDDLADLARRLDEGVDTARELPHRSAYLLIVIDFLNQLLALYGELVDRVEREFAGPS